MNPTEWPIAISTADDTATAGVRLWRQRQQLFATVAVKATFTLVPGATMTLRAPLPIERAERTVAQSEGIEPGDLAPCLVQPEIWLRGHAWHPPAQGATSVRARLVVARDGTPLVRKSVEIQIQPDAFVPPYLHALGPLSQTWPIRTRLLGGIAPESLDRSPIELPDVFDWNYFQATHADQRLGPLRGDEWIRLEGIHPTIYQFDTRLPAAWCVIMLFGSVEPLRQGKAVRVGLDSVQVNADHGYCSLVFRGHTQLPPQVALEDLQFVAALGLPNRPIPKLEAKPTPSHEHASAPPGPAESNKQSGGVTVALDVSTLQAPVAGNALPFQEGSYSPPAPIPQPPASLVSPRKPSDKNTSALDLATLRSLTGKDALPFHQTSSAPSIHRPPSDKPPLVEIPHAATSPIVAPPPFLSEPPAAPAMATAAPPNLATQSARAARMPDLTQTLNLTQEMFAQLAAGPVTPFAGGDPPPPREEVLDALSALPFRPVSPDERAPCELGAFFLAAMEETLRSKGQSAFQRTSR